MKKLTITLFLFITLIACTAETGKDCESSSGCSEKGVNAPASNLRLKLFFNESTFYDQEKKSFRDITSNQILTGNLGERIPVYVDFLGLTTQEALQSILQSTTQRDNINSFLESDLNTIPYFAIRAIDDQTIIYEYKKYTQTGSEAASHNGVALKSGDTFYIPIINDMFDGKFFNASAGGSQSNYTHQIRFAAQSPNSTDSEIITVNFNANLIVPNKDFDVELSTDMQNLTLKNRWNFLYDGSDGVTNTELMLGDLVEKTDAANPAQNLDNKDIRVVFKTRPNIEMVYTLFDEENLVKESTDVDSNVSIVRGYNFYEKAYILDSDSDFDMVFKINGNDITLNDGTNVTGTSADKEGVLRDVGAGIPWRISFGYNLTQKATYPSGKTLLKPLRPFCNSVTKTPYSPIAMSNLKTQVNGLGGFAAICHPDILQQESVSAANVPSYTYDKIDTFYENFSYMTKKEITSDDQHVRTRPGHFYGIRSIEFRVSGCLKLYIRDASLSTPNPNPWVQKNEETESCSSGPGDEGWLAYSISKEVSIFENVDQYDGISGLKEIINNYRNSVPESSTDFYFNDDNFVEHIH